MAAAEARREGGGIFFLVAGVGLFRLDQGAGGRDCPPGPLVGGEGLGGEGDLAGLGVGVGVDDPEDAGGAHAEEHHVEHAHVPQELPDPGAGGAEGAAGVLAALAASWVAPEAQPHALGGCRHQHHHQAD